MDNLELLYGGRRPVLLPPQFIYPSWQSWQCTHVVQSSAVKSLSTGRHHCLCKLFTYVNNWVRGWAHSYHRHPRSLFLSSRCMAPLTCLYLSNRFYFITAVLQHLISSKDRRRGRVEMISLLFRLNLTRHAPMIMSQFKPWSFCWCAAQACYDRATHSIMFYVPGRTD